MDGDPLCYGLFLAQRMIDGRSLACMIDHIKQRQQRVYSS